MICVSGDFGVLAEVQEHVFGLKQDDNERKEPDTDNDSSLDEVGSR